MNKIITSICIATLSIFSACADEEPDHDSALQNSSKPLPAATIPAAVPATGGAQMIPGSSTPSLPGQPSATVAPLPASMVNQATTTTAPGMNPPHGQPNHRCDIEVGAPLNSPATKPATQTVSPTVTQTTTPATTAKTVTAPGMNPPHGEPNHRCDIAVGAPLNSPATKPAVQTVAPVTIPAKKDSGS